MYLGGEYTIRGFDIRSIGPRDLETGLVLGGNKTLLFNAEYLINIAGPVRLVLFYDTGQVRNIGQSFAWKEDINIRVDPGLPPIIDPFTTTRLVDSESRRRRTCRRLARPTRSRPRRAPRSGSSCRC